MVGVVMVAGLLRVVVLDVMVASGVGLTLSLGDSCLHHLADLMRSIT